MAPEGEDGVAILYGSQTGTAEEVAWDLARDCRQRGFRCRDPCAMGEVNVQGLRELRTVIFVVATTGQGDPPVNMKRFWQELLPVTLSKTLLSGLRFAVFGLGDSRYREFNYAARKLHARLLGLGAESFFRLGLGDEQHDFGLEQELDPWVEALWGPLAELCPPRAQAEPSTYKCRYLVEEVAEAASDASEESKAEAAVFDAEVLSNHSLCTERHAREEQDVRNVRLALPPGTSYVSGDVCVVWPRAERAVVRQFVEETLGMDLRTRVRVRPAAAAATPNGGCTAAEARTASTPAPAVGSSCSFPDRPMTLEELFTTYVDLTAVPSRHFFQVLSRYTDHELHHTKLAEFGSRTLEAKDALYEYCKREKRSAAEVMFDFWSARPPLAELLEALPPMRPRRYSIASCPRWCSATGSTPEEAARFWVGYQRSRGYAGHSWATRLSSRVARAALAEALARQWLPELSRAEPSGALQTENAAKGSGSAPVAANGARCALDLCVAVVEFTTKTNRKCQGLCSSYLRAAEPGAIVRCSLESGSLSLPPMAVPLIMICPGTGLSPCRALVQQRHLEVEARPPSASRRGDMRDLLFLGFRHEDGDYLYGDEWSTFSDWLAVHVAFSRDHEDRKVYVQDKIEEAGAHVCRLLDAGAHVFVCGRSHPMPSQVFDAFVEVLCVHRRLSPEAAAARLRELQRTRRYICDTWG
eukprot:TRINITY_DN25609_c0_g1_i1.p1 TRINITY_DN25609_c0_g1~~TRINITY_DN25609_c0_g1_i1.p1  ORF type:complete len:699 (-),score=151.10 TRINITY_DN25609_c0_g1_i1:109-2205(-)